MLFSVLVLKTPEQKSSFATSALIMGFLELMQNSAENEYTDSVSALQDEELLRDSLKNPQLFSFIVDRYQEAFLRAALRVVRSKEEAEDIVQEAFTKIYMNAPKFQKQEGASFKSWGYKIVLNTAFTHYRKMQKHKDNGVEFEDPMLVEQVLAIAANETPLSKHIVAEAMEELPQDLRTILTTHYLEDRPYKEIAKKNKTTVSAIKMKLFRARQAFKKVVEAGSEV